MSITESKNAAANTVSAQGQLKVNDYVTIYSRGGKKRVLFFGNSITRHDPAPAIGWHGEWGMAASCAERDYVHLVVAELDKIYGKVDYCVTQGAAWEFAYDRTPEVLSEYYSSARDFDADIIIVRIGENIKAENHLKLNCKPYFDQAIRFLAKREDAVVVLTDMFWYSCYNECIKEIAMENGYLFCHITDLENDERTMAIGLFDHDGVAHHPSDFGMQCIADRIMEAIKNNI